jgi:hypothetical protein
MKRSDSRKALDNWLAPEGAGRPVRCVATSFTFDPDFFETDCLSRFLGLDSKKGEGEDLAAMIEEDERLSETTVTVVVDRSDRPANRNLRWDLLPVGIEGGLMHAKVAVLAWENVVRFIVGSANLTRAGYRGQVEALVALDATRDCELPEEVFLDLISALRSIVARNAGDEKDPGPKQRALESLAYFESFVRDLNLNGDQRRQPMRIAAVVVEPGRSALDQIAGVWWGGPARWAAVMSPFFDESEGPSAAVDSLARIMAQRGERELRIVLPTDRFNKNLIRAPAAIAAAKPKGIDIRFEGFKHDPKEPRRLHAKALILQNQEWTALMIGSSNFTAAGLGLLRRGGHVEVNLAFGSSDRRIVEQFEAVVPEGDPIDPSSVRWEPDVDEDQPFASPLPLGFLDCLVEPGANPILFLRFDIGRLPKRWKIELPTGDLVLDSAGWESNGKPSETQVSLQGTRLPFWLQVHWQQKTTWLEAGWPVNVTHPSRLAPPDELRDLPVAALLAALASTRPIHEAVAAAIEAEEKRKVTAALDPELDPLRRFSSTGLLLHRARKLSAALAGLRRRLERPLANAEALHWRLNGPFGPRAVAEGLIRESEASGFLEGEVSFSLAELALTLSRVEWKIAGDAVTQESVREATASVLTEIRELEVAVEKEPALSRYVARAFTEAGV